MRIKIVLITARCRTSIIRHGRQDQDGCERGGGWDAAGCGKYVKKKSAKKTDKK
jgi:hypothetical protein